MHLKYCKINKIKKKKLIEHFIAGTPARTVAELISVHRNTGTKFYHELREKIAKKQQQRAEKFDGKIEVDEREDITKEKEGGEQKGKC